MEIIARIYTDFSEKFGIPRQSGIAKTLGKIVFEPKYRSTEALRGLEGYSHIWMIWQFSEAVRDSWTPTVRPPRLGGNKRMGVFATRSPYRPNPIGLSSVKLISIKKTSTEGTVLIVEGADILSGTPIYDIKPYLAYTDSHPDAVCGFADEALAYKLTVKIPDTVKGGLTERELSDIEELLAGDPRPSYQDDSEREYGMIYKDYEVHFTVDNSCATVKRIEKCK